LLDGARFLMDTVATRSEDSATLFALVMSLTDEGVEVACAVTDAITVAVVVVAVVIVAVVVVASTVYAAQYTRQSCALLRVTVAKARVLG